MFPHGLDKNAFDLNLFPHFPLSKIELDGADQRFGWLQKHSVENPMTVT